VSNDPYAAPAANLENVADAPVIPTKVMSAKGRLSVVSYWGQIFLLTLISYAIYAVLGFLAYTFGDVPLENLTSIESIGFSNPIIAVLGVIGLVVYIATIVISVLMMIKRLHDRNHSGWWILGLVAALVLTAFVFEPAVIIPILGFLYLIFFPGQKGSNRFGGRRETKGWEKVLCILFIILIVVGIVALFTVGADLAQSVG